MADTSIKAVMVAADEIGLELVKILKAGGGPVAEVEAAISFITSNDDFRAKVGAAISAIGNIPAEIPTLGIADFGDLVATEVGYVTQIVAALKA